MFCFIPENDLCSFDKFNGQSDWGLFYLCIFFLPYFVPDEKASEQNRALYLLHRWQDISPGKYSLVPEHLEARTLYHPSKPGEPQVKIRTLLYFNGKKYNFYLASVQNVGIITMILDLKAIFNENIRYFII